MNEVDAIKSKKDLEKMRKALSRNPRDLLLFNLGINIGLRIGDLLSLRWSSVLDNNKIADVITVKEQKTGKTRKIRLNVNAKKALTEQRVAVTPDPQDFLFKSRKGDNQALSKVQAYRILSDASVSARIKGKIGTHTMRKTFGYWAYKSGIDITLLMELFNHSSQKITLRYIGITQEDIENVYLSLDI